MSFIKSDSLLSNIKNVSIRIDMKPTDGSNIFQSLIYNNQQEKQKSIKLQSLFDYDGNRHNINQQNSLIQKLINPPYKQQKQSNAYHYNWLVCKNSAGLSEQQDNGSESNDSNIKKSKNQSSTKTVNLQPQNAFVPQKNLSIVEQQFRQISQQKQSENSAVINKKIKNETKNIPKNYGKAIICFIERYHQKVLRITQMYDVDYNALLEDLKRKKKSINTIADLRTLWSDYKYAKCMRVISMVFFRKHSLSYIFDSRICTYGSHIKYRQRLCEAVSNPLTFRHIKDY